ncbi:thioesterase family protein [Maricaulis sp. CAU 1757]
MIELWRGSVNAWECDELGHMNVRFYLAKASEAIGWLAAEAGLGRVYHPSATATLIPRDIHIRFVAEARPGAPLYITGGFLDIAEDQATIQLVMRHSGSDRIAALYRIVVGHAEPNEGVDFAWPNRFAAQAERLKIEAFPDAGPRGLSLANSEITASRARADDLGLSRIGRGHFSQAEMDGFGVLCSEFLLGRISDSVTNFEAAFPEDFSAHREGRPANIASALLECHIRPARWPRAGDSFMVRSGLKSIGPKVRNIVHWVLDPASGHPWWTMEGVAAPLDLDNRRIAPVGDELRAELEARCIPDLSA